MTETPDDVLEELPEIYDGDPDPLPRDVDGRQDDTGPAAAEALRSLVGPIQNNTEEALGWYRDEATSPPFDPDGMCLKVCRTARNIGPMFPSAIAAQLATPMVARRESVAGVRRGMVAYYDDPNDDNPFGHIVTVAGRAPGEDPSTLRSLIVWTNSVVANKLVAVRGDYFPRVWGDQFRFGATWLNGVDLLLPTPPAPRPTPVQLGETFKNAIALVEKSRAFHKGKGHTRVVNALDRDLAELRETLKTING